MLMVTSRSERAARRSGESRAAGKRSAIAASVLAPRRDRAARGPHAARRAKSHAPCRCRHVEGLGERAPRAGQIAPPPQRVAAQGQVHLPDEGLLVGFLGRQWVAASAIFGECPRRSPPTARRAFGQAGAVGEADALADRAERARRPSRISREADMNASRSAALRPPANA